ncbi:MAG TPA: MFS transporter [Steroidobacteraceae bacterium]|nr:MFS transporter [Steroidobacteraceae bacterium]
MTPSQSEFRRGWTVLVASSLGVAFGASPIPYNSLGAFTLPIAEEFGWGRGDVQLGVLWYTIAVVCIVPLVGALADRFGVRRMALLTLAAFGVCFALIGLTPGSLVVFYGLWFFAGLLGGGSTPVTWTRAVNSWFVVNRGLALAITLLGTGITAAFLPTLTIWLIERFGWRWAYFGIALLPLAIALPIAIRWFREPPEKAPAGGGGLARRDEPGFTLREALRNYRFWVMVVSILLVATGIGGTITNLVPLLVDRGFTPIEAGKTAGAIGVSIIFGRLFAGFLMDRFWAPGVVFPMLALPALACMILMGQNLGVGMATVAAVLVGFASGAETDLVAFMSARYFGLKHYGRIYGVQYAVFGFASGIAPALFGGMYDRTGSYDAILVIAAIAFGIGAMLMLTMGRYPVFTPPPADTPA